MPFGKYAAQKLANVPAGYLLWLKDQIEHKAPNKRSLNEKLLLAYILENKDVLEKEVKGN